MSTGRFDQLRSDPDPVTRFTNTALEDVADVQGISDLLHVDRLILVTEARIARRHHQVTETRQFRDDVLGHAIGEVIVVLLGAHVGEWQDGDRRSRRQGLALARRASRARFRMCAGSAEGVDANRAQDVFHLLLAKEVPVEITAIGDKVVGRARQGETARL